MPEPRTLAPEADLATVLQLATNALQRGILLDPEELLCQLLGLNPAQLQDWLELPLRTLTTEPGTPERDAELAKWADDDEASRKYLEAVAGPAPDRSVPASRARAREETWRVAEAGTLAHLIGRDREPLCGSVDPGPWRAVSGALCCAACVDLSEVLARHG